MLVRFSIGRTFIASGRLLATARCLQLRERAG